MRSFNPCANCIFNICERFLRSLTIAQATGKIGDSRCKAAAIFGGEGLNDDGIALNVHGSAFTSSTNLTNLRTYTGLMGRLKGMVSLFGISG